MSLKDQLPHRISLFPKVRLIGRTACFCYFSVILLFMSLGRLDVLEETGMLKILVGLALLSGLLSLVKQPRTKR